MYRFTGFTEKANRALNAAVEIAENLGFINANRKDSQDICFVPDGDYAAFIEHVTKKTPKPGNFVDLEGNVLGYVKGIV